MNLDKDTSLSWLTLLTATSTWLCCVLPIVLVSLGFGATLAALIGTFPVLVALTQHKLWLFVISGLLLATSRWRLYRSGQNCPSDTEAAERCMSTQRLSRRLLQLSVAIWTIGAGAALLAEPIARMLE